mmetsp:Transcript_26753/g.51896  ORF Transcript_26753/g.51896 Transcript_26753/m.51896 type:complete len:88 (-) Transcript_26753:91-354(-)
MLFRSFTFSLYIGENPYRDNATTPLDRLRSIDETCRSFAAENKMMFSSRPAETRRGTNKHATGLSLPLKPHGDKNKTIKKRTYKTHA